MTKKKKLVTAGAAFAVAAAALTPVASVDAAQKRVIELAPMTFVGGEVKLPAKVGSSKITWYKSGIDMKKVNTWQTIKGYAGTKKVPTTIKIKIANYVVGFQQSVAPQEVEVDGKLVLPAKLKANFAVGAYFVDVKWAEAKTDKAGDFEVKGTYTRDGKTISVVAKYKVVDGEVAFSDVKNEVKEDTLSVSADVKNLKDGEKVELVIFPGKDESKALPAIAAEVKDGKVTASAKEVPAGTHSFILRSGDVKTAATEFKVEAPMVKSVNAINSTQAVVTFNREIGEAFASNFSIDQGLAVIKAEINPDNKKEVKLTFNSSLTDRTDYKVSVEGVKFVSGAELKDTLASEFTYEIGEVSKIELTKTTFVNAEDIVDFVKLSNEANVNVTDKYTVEVSSTSANVTSTAGTVGGVTANEVAFVQVTVKSGSTVVKTSDAIKVELKASDVSSLVSFGLGADVNTETAYKAALKAGNLTTDMKKSETPNLELLVNDNGSERLVTGADVTKIENLTPTVATVSVASGELVVDAYATGTAQAKLTIGGKVFTISFTVKADSKIAASTLSSSNVYFNTSNSAPAETSAVNVNVVDQYNKAILATVAPASPATTATVVAGGVNYTMTVKSSNTSIATAVIDAVASPASTLPITITEAGKGTATITVELKDASGAVVFTKAIAVNGKDAGALAGYVIETDASAIDLDKDVSPEANDDAVNFTVYSVDAQGNKIATVPATLDIQGYASTPLVSNFINVSGQSVAVSDVDAYKSFAGTGTLNVDVKVNGTKIGTKAISYSNSDSVATKAVVNTVDVVIDNDKVSGTDAALTLTELFYGHYDAVNAKYTLAPKLTILDQSGKAIDWDSATPGTLVNTDAVSNLSFVTTNVSDVVISGGSVTLASGKTSGSFTVVVSDIDTTEASDILAAPVAFNVTIVE